MRRKSAVSPLYLCIHFFQKKRFITLLYKKWILILQKCNPVREDDYLHISIHYYLLLLIELKWNSHPEPKTSHTGRSLFIWLYLKLTHPVCIFTLALHFKWFSICGFSEVYTQPFISMHNRANKPWNHLKKPKIQKGDHLIKRSCIHL
jgi:hypothetical protein